MAKSSKSKSDGKLLYVGYSVAITKGVKSIHFHTSGQQDRYAVFMPLPNGSNQPNSQAFTWYSLPPGTKSKADAAKWLAAKKVPAEVKKYLTEKASNLSA